MTNDITILSCPICNNPKLREYGNGIYQCDVCETYFDKDENIVLTEQEWLQTATTEQLAEVLFSWYKLGRLDVINKHTEVKKDWLIEHLKQPHREE